MCGIFCVADKTSGLSDTRLLAALDEISHRGPDGEGHLIEKALGPYTVGLGHRRLSIFDVTSAGSQPMTAWGNRSIIYNGEIFNWPELRSELSRAGYSFSTNCDTEVILAAYDCWGDRCVERFNGFWSFAILERDATGRPTQLFLSRDRLGIKPLYLYTREGKFVFSSEISAIWAYLDSRPVPNLKQLSRLLVFDKSHDSEKTIYQDIEEVLPGFNVIVDLASGRIAKQKYWSLDAQKEFDERPASDDYEEFVALLHDSVKIRLRSDRPVALTLSGGVDSSVLAVAARQVSSSDITAFTSHFPEMPDLDESSYASLVARKLDIEHVLVEPKFLDLPAEAKKLTRHQELTFTSFSMLINWAVVESVRSRGFPVYLTGQGGDEVFFGYERYFVPYIMRLVNNPAVFFRELNNLAKNSKLNIPKLIAYLLYFSNGGVRNYVYKKRLKNIFTDEFIGYSGDAPVKLSSNFEELFSQEVCGEQLRRLLRYEDRTSSAFGVEARPPLLDHRLVELSYRMRWRDKIANGWSKYLLRQYLANNGFPEVAWRTHKLGYPAPSVNWATQLVANGMDIPSSLKSIFCDDTSISNVRQSELFKVYNLIETSNVLEWDSV